MLGDFGFVFGAMRNLPNDRFFGSSKSIGHFSLLFLFIYVSTMFNKRRAY